MQRLRDGGALRERHRERQHRATNVGSLADYLPPAWVSRLRRTRRSVLVYKPAMLLAALDLIEDGVAEPDRIPLDLCARRFAELLVRTGWPASRAAPAEMPIFHLSTSRAPPQRVPFWRLLSNGQVRDDLDEPGSLGALLRQSDAAAFVEPLRADVATVDGRQRIRWAIYDLLESDGEPTSGYLDRSLHRTRSRHRRLDYPGPGGARAAYAQRVRKFLGQRC